MTRCILRACVAGLFVFCGISRLAGAQDKILLIDTGTLTRATPTTTSSPAQPVALTWRDRGVFLDGTVRDSWNLQLAANPGDPGAVGEARVEDVRLFTGQYAPTEIELALPCPGPDWIVGRTRRNPTTSAGSVHGAGWYQISQPQLIYEDVPLSLLDRMYICYGGDRYAEFVRVVRDGTPTDTFRGVNGTAGAIDRIDMALGGGENRMRMMRAEFSAIQSLTLWTYHDPLGQTAVFFGANSLSGAGAASWQLWKLTDASGYVAYAGNADDPFAAIASGYDSGGRIIAAFDSANRRYLYNYALVAGQKRLMSVVAEVDVNETPTQVGRVEYEYYTSTSTDANAADLKLARVVTPVHGGTLEETTAYRYWTASSPSTIDGLARGPNRSVRIVLSPEGYRKFSASGNWLTATDSALEPYSEVRLGYDAAGNVSAIKSDGLPQRRLNIAYEVPASPPSSINGYDKRWAQRSIATLKVAEATYRSTVTYFDEVGQSLSNVVAKGEPDVSGAARWCGYVSRNDSGQVIAVGMPDSISSYSHSTAEFEFNTGGMVEHFTRVPTGAQSAPELDGFAAAVEVSQGMLGPHTRLSAFNYAPIGDGKLPCRELVGYTVLRPLLTSVVRYPTEVGTDPGIATTVSYHLPQVSGSEDLGLTIDWIEITHPAVSTAHHGSGEPTTSAVSLTPNGMIQFVRERGDAHGNLTYCEFDLPDSGNYGSGLLTRLVENAAPGDAGVPQLPAGFPSGSQQAFGRVSTYVYDLQGRVTSMTDPSGLVTDRAYSKLGDGRLAIVSAFETQSAWVSPGALRVINLAGRTEASAAIAFGDVIPGYGSVSTTVFAPQYWINPDSTDALHCLSEQFPAEDGSAIRKGRVYIHDGTGTRTLQFRKYHAMPATGSGDTTHHYDPTDYAYDDLGRMLSSTDPSRTSDVLTYDVLDRPQDILRGVEGQVPTLTATLTYDDGNPGGNSLLTSQTRFADGVGRTTYFRHDWRGRLLAIANPLAPHTLFAWDNMGRRIASASFGGAQGAGSESGFLDLVDAGILPTATGPTRASVDESSLDEMGQEWRQTRTVGSGLNGDIDSIVTDSWYDARGRVVLRHGVDTQRFTYDDCGCAADTWMRCIVPSLSPTLSLSEAMSPTLPVHVLEQMMSYHDPASNRLLARTMIQRSPRSNAACNPTIDQFFGGTPGAIDVNYSQLSACHARAETTAQGYDPLNRPNKTVKVGDPRLPQQGSPDVTINMGNYGPGVNSTSLPARGDYVTFNNLGEAVRVENERGDVHETEFDDADRPISEMEKLGINYSTDVGENPCESGDGGSDDGTSTDYTYDKDRLKEICVGGACDSEHPPALTVDYPDTSTQPPTDICAGGGLCSSDPLNDNTLPKTISLPGSFLPGESAPNPVDRFDYRHNAQGEVTAVRDSSGTTSVVAHDSMGRPSMSTFAYPGGHDATGLPLVAPGPTQINWARDSFGRLNSVQQTLAAGNSSSSLTHDGWGNITSFQHDFILAGNSGGPVPVSLPAAIGPVGTEYAWAPISQSATSSFYWQTPRLTGMDLPGNLGGGPDIVYAYSGDRINDSYDANAVIGRVSSIGVAPGDEITKYGYYGLYLPSEIENPESGFVKEVFNPDGLSMAVIPATLWRQSDAESGLNPWGDSNIDRWMECAGTCTTPESSPFDQRIADPLPQDLCACSTGIMDANDPRENTDEDIICSGMVQSRRGPDALVTGSSLQPPDIRAVESWQLSQGNWADHKIQKLGPLGQLYVEHHAQSSHTQTSNQAFQSQVQRRLKFGEPDVYYASEPRYDAKGNLRDEGYTETDSQHYRHARVYEYDMFNNLVAVYIRNEQTDGTGVAGPIIAAFGYDAMGHRVSARYNMAALARTPDKVEDDDFTSPQDYADFYVYDTQWRVRAVIRQVNTTSVQTHDADDPNHFTWLRERWVYQNAGPGDSAGLGAAGDDAPLLRMIDDDADGVFEHQHFLCNRRGDVVAITEPAASSEDGGAIIARVYYESFGHPRLVEPLDIDHDGDVDYNDHDVAWPEVLSRASDPLTAERWRRAADFDNDGDFDPDDAIAFELAWSTTPPDPVATRLGSIPLYGGYWYDQNLDLYFVRHRVYDANSGRWLQRDPIGYDGGWNLYEYVKNQPRGNVDPEGLYLEDIATRLANSDNAITRGIGKAVGVLGGAAEGVVDGASMIADHAVGTFSDTVHNHAQKIRENHQGEWEYTYGDKAGAVGVEVGKVAALGAVGQVAGCSSVVGQTARFGLRAVQAADTLNTVMDGATIVNAIQNRDWNTAINTAGSLAMDYVGARLTGFLAGSIVCFDPATPIQTPFGPVPISAIRVGDRVITDADNLSEPDLDWSQFREFEITCIADDGMPVCQIQLLRHQTWLPKSQIGTVSTPLGLCAMVSLDLPEVGVRGAAIVTGIRPCPDIVPGFGRVVLMTSQSISRDLVSLHLKASVSSISATATHPIYSEDRGMFVPIGDLSIGERVRTADGWALVENLARERGEDQPCQLVCNLEVEGTHTFLVGELGLVSHNDSVRGGSGCRVPNPYGRKGGPKHQAEVKRLERHFELMGMSTIAEYRIDTPGGLKPYRYVDLAVFDASGKLVSVHQVGRALASGAPPLRERDAVSDILNFSSITSKKTYFIPYNR